jgi:GH35 family endo-1,4-beta-xylanase
MRGRLFLGICLLVAAIFVLAEAWPQGSAEADKAALQRAQEAIERDRKGDILIVVQTEKGLPVSAVRVAAEQVSSTFRVGCNIFGFGRFSTAEENALYGKRFEEVFDFATLPFYWRGYEPQRGKPQHAYRDTVARWCKDREIAAKGHPLAWTVSSGRPRWVESLSSEESLGALKGRITDCVSYFKGLINAWDVVNEPTHTRPWPGTNSTADYVESSLKWARQANPDALLVVNEYYVIQDTEGKGPFYQLVEELIRRNAPFDAIGLQCHEPRTDWYPLDMVEKTLQTYSRLGKRIHVTEFTPTSSGKAITGSYHKGVWDEKAQADYAEQFFRVCFGNPAVDCIVWWDLCEAKAWLEGGGLLRKDLTPKEVYHRIQRLVREEWRTRCVGLTGEEGNIEFRGFHGKYRLTLEKDGMKETREFEVSPGKPTRLIVTLSRGGEK